MSKDGDDCRKLCNHAELSKHKARVKQSQTASLIAPFQINKGQLDHDYVSNESVSVMY